MYFLGPALGSALFSVGGFTLPYIVVASLALIMAIVLSVVVPKVYTDAKEEGDSSTVKMTFASLLTVTFWRDSNLENLLYSQSLEILIATDIAKILNLYIIILCTHLFHFLPVSIHYLQCIHCLLQYSVIYVGLRYISANIWYSTRYSTDIRLGIWLGIRLNIWLKVE